VVSPARRRGGCSLKSAILCPDFWAQYTVCTFGLATNRNWTTETGKKREGPEYHRLVAWETLAEFCSKYLRKGRKVYVEGRLHTRSYTAKDGTEKAATEIVVDELVLLDAMPDTVREALEFQKPQ
jgi:single stranded DNA-binding protein